MRRYLILGIALVVCWLSFSYMHRRQWELGTQVVAHAYWADLIAVKNDVEQGATLNYSLCFDDEQRNYHNQCFNALHAAASGGNEDIILFLLDKGFAINSQTDRGWTPLFIAARDGHAEAAKLLIYKQADVNVQTDLGATALTMVLTQPYPTEKARLQLLEYMLKRGADPTLKDSYGHDAFYYAAHSANAELLALLRRFSASADDVETVEP